MNEYPEHDKLHKVAEDSQTIGLFLDLGLGEQGLVLYERITRDCECNACRRRGGRTEGMHTDAERALADKNNGKVPVTEYHPTQRTIQSILASYFGIDEKKLAEEKDAIYQDIRNANA
jgi:hypothetical protein